MLLAGMQKKKWEIAPADHEAEELAGKLKISPIIAQVLINRRIHEADRARSFLSPKLTELIEPENMPGAEDAAARVKGALEAGKKIAIYGDYDVDGITGVAILWHLLEILGGDVEYYIPHRIEEGYGLNEDAIKQIAENGTKLIITVDCGITAVREVEFARGLGMEVIITDHHQADDVLPGAEAIVHPMIAAGYGNCDSAGAMGPPHPCGDPAGSEKARLDTFHIGTTSGLT